MEELISLNIANDKYNKYFNSKKDQYTFALLEMSGETRMKLLGITKINYYNRNIATKWYIEIHDIIDDQEALFILDEIYCKMIDI
jgi:hypothetical protein